MASLEQIIRPFVVDPTTPPVPYVTTSNDPPPDPVRLNIGIGGTRLSDLSSLVGPIVPPPSSTTTSLSTKPTIQKQETSSSYSLSITWYQDEQVKEIFDQSQGDPFGVGGNPFGIGVGLG
jgi:hypothetical protein